MTSLSDECLTLLQSNVKGNPRNKPNLYETEQSYLIYLANGMWL